MRKLIITALAAVMALSLSAGIASARTGLTVDDTSATLTIPSLELHGALELDIRCPVTLDVTFHASVSKTVGSLAGFADVAVGTCSENRGGLLSGRNRVTELRGFHVTYSGFGGTLPSITEVSLVVNDVTFWISGGGLECLTEGPQDILGTSTGRNPATGMNVRAAGIRLDGDFPCDFTTGSMDGVGTLDEAVGIRLI